jgi:farnesyl diphosphate synthase
MDNFAGRLTQRADEIAILLGDLLGTEPLPGEIARPERLIAAMRHGVLNGGKRLRPFLLVETALMLGGSHGTAMRAAAALECVHCYSLIHDDLPAMDDDDLRRGQPTVHRAFDEATAILAGDALLTLAFDILADPQTHEDPAIRSALVLALARASGMGGMAGGQMLDLAAEHRQLGVDEIGTMQSMKTGALIRCACEMGAIAADADSASAGALRRFGELVGKAFQLADDILDVTPPRTRAVARRLWCRCWASGKAAKLPRNLWSKPLQRLSLLATGRRGWKRPPAISSVAITDPQERPQGKEPVAHRYI